MSENKCGRPQADIDWNYVDELLHARCSGREIAADLGINPHTLYDRCLSDHGVMFAEYSQQKYAKGDRLLKKQQFDKALGLTKDGDNTLLIWLGKTRLEQKEMPTEIAFTDKEKTLKDVIAESDGKTKDLVKDDSDLHE